MGATRSAFQSQIKGLTEATACATKIKTSLMLSYAKRIFSWSKTVNNIDKTLLTSKIFTLHNEICGTLSNDQYELRKEIHKALLFKIKNAMHVGNIETEISLLRQQIQHKDQIISELQVELSFRTSVNENIPDIAFKLAVLLGDNKEETSDLSKIVLNIFSNHNSHHHKWKEETKNLFSILDYGGPALAKIV